MKELVAYWNKVHSPLIMEYSSYDYYKDNKSYTRFIIKIKDTNSNIIYEESGDDFLQLYLKCSYE